jgi:ferredoxin-NADP reductase
MSQFNTAEFMDPVKTQTWTNGRHLVRCSKVIQETHDVRTFTFNMGQPILFFFKPGQFVTLELEIDGERVMRSYTISSSPSIPYSFSITVKRIPGGEVSNWLFDNLNTGDQIAVHGPVGNFNCLDFPAEKVLLLSGGVGITPVMSMARWWFDTDADVDIQFVHCARSPRDMIYQHELAYMSSRIDNFQLHLVCERTEVGQVWGGYRGRLDEHMLRLIAPDFLEREVFCCGPEPYMSAVRTMLRQVGFDMSRYHEESFDATPKRDEAVAEAHAEEAAIEAEEQVLEMVTLRFADSGTEVPVAIGTNLNEAAREAGIVIPKACGIGICGACRVRVTAGKADMVHNGGITDEEVEEGYVLSCCSTVTGDLEIEY